MGARTRACPAPSSVGFVSGRWHPRSGTLRHNHDIRACTSGRHRRLPDPALTFTGTGPGRAFFREGLRRADAKDPPSRELPICSWESATQEGASQCGTLAGPTGRNCHPELLQTRGSPGERTGPAVLSSFSVLVFLHRDEPSPHQGLSRGETGGARQKTWQVGLMLSRSSGSF